MADVILTKKKKHTKQNNKRLQLEPQNKIVHETRLFQF